MKQKFKYLLMAMVLAVMTGSFNSCVKIWEEERIEIIPCPCDDKVDIEPDVPGWDDQNK